jgi:hypothetical protein
LFLDEPTNLSQCSVLIAGVGNIGSHLAPLLARAGVGRILLVDRDTVEPKNLSAQDYQPEDVGQPKASVQAARLQPRFPGCSVEAWKSDIEDLPLGRARCNVILGALDSRRARQVLISEIAWPLGIPVVDGGVGDPLLGRVQVFQPDPETACLECTWGQADYRLLAGEYPCIPGASAAGPPTSAPAYLGCFTAALMATECLRLLGCGPDTPGESYEVAFDLSAPLFRRFGLRRSPRCRHDHAIGHSWYTLPSEATLGQVLDQIEQVFGAAPVGIECRRGLGEATSGGARLLARETLERCRTERLLDRGFVSGDVLRVRGAGRQVFLELTGESGR